MVAKGLRRYAAFKIDGWTMRRVIVIAAASLGLAGCSSFSSFSLDSMKSPPPPVNVQFESTPPGAEARTSLGPSCTTPCSLPVTADGSFSVSFTLAKYTPLTVPVTVTRVPGDFTTAASTTIDPNPVSAELQPAKPLKGKSAIRRPARKRKPAAAAPGAAPDAGGAPDAGSSAFPPPSGTAPPR
jgi:hypothetical protein